MQIIHEAIIEDYHFIVSTDWMTITHKGEEVVHLNRDRMFEAIGWLNAEASAIYAAVNAGRTQPQVVPTTPIEHPEEHKVRTPTTPVRLKEGTDYEVRRAKTTAILPKPDERPGGEPSDSINGERRIFDTEVVDLGKLSAEIGKVTS